MADDSNPNPHPSAAQWEAHRAIITELRQNPENTLDDIMKEMRKRDFHGTKAAYKKKFREWGLSKYISSAAAIEADRKRKEREHEGKTTVIFINGKPISNDKIERHLKRVRKTGDVNVEKGA